MGSKIKTFKISAIIFLTFLFTILIPLGVTDAQDINPIVRVAISDQNFKSFVYNEISVIATQDFGLYDKSTSAPIAKFGANDVVKAVYKNGKFEIFQNDKSIAKDITSELIFDCREGVLGIKDLKRSGKQALYHGNFELIPKDENLFYLVNILDLQEYLKGVVPNEMPVRFGLEALKAQAVAARNYVLMPRTKAYNEFDVDDSVASQVYYGANTEDELATKAVVETQGLVAMYNSKLILAQYCSTAGGYTENWNNAFPDSKTKMFYPINPKPYLKGKADILTMSEPLDTEEAARNYYTTSPVSYDMRSPYYRWQKEFTFDEINEILPKMLVSQSKTGFVNPKLEQEADFGNLKDIKVLRRGVSGKVMELQIISDKGSWKVSKELVIRRVFPKNGISLPSANIVFDITRENDINNENDISDNNTSTNFHINKNEGNITSIKIYGGGFGHGVGMSQFGAGFMACELHKSFDKILKRYYTGISISTIPVTVSDEDGQKNAQIQFYAPEKKAVLVVENQGHIKNFNVNINNVEVIIELENTSLLKGEFRKDISQYIKKGQNLITVDFPENNKNKKLKLYVELVEKDDSEYNF